MALLLHNIMRFAAAKPSARLMYDDYDGTTIPTSAPMVARYHWWTTAQVERFIKTGVPIVLIATQANQDYGDVLDVEAGDATPSQAHGWLAMRKKSAPYNKPGTRPTIYCARSNVTAVRAGTGSYVLGVDYDLWVADWTNKPHEIAGAVATQYANVGTKYDLSSVYDAGWPHRTETAPPKPKAYRHVADGTKTLAQVAKSRNTTTDHIAWVSMQYLSAANKVKFTRYLAAGSGPMHLMPKGLVYWTTNK